MVEKQNEDGKHETGRARLKLSKIRGSRCLLIGQRTTR